MMSFFFFDFFLFLFVFVFFFASLKLKSIPIKLSEPDFKCAICFNEAELPRHPSLSFPCSHGFHLKCVTVWMTRFEKLSESTCPLCRTKLLDVEAIDRPFMDVSKTKNIKVTPVCSSIGATLAVATGAVRIRFRGSFCLEDDDDHHDCLMDKEVKFDLSEGQAKQLRGVLNRCLENHVQEYYTRPSFQRGSQACVASPTGTVQELPVWFMLSRPFVRCRVCGVAETVAYMHENTCVACRINNRFPEPGNEQRVVVASNSYELVFRRMEIVNNVTDRNVIRSLVNGYLRMTDSCPYDLFATTSAEQDLARMRELMRERRHSTTDEESEEGEGEAENEEGPHTSDLENGPFESP